MFRFGRKKDDSVQNAKNNAQHKRGAANSKKKAKPKHKKFKRPGDVKIYYVMPTLLAFALVGMVGAGIKVQQNGAVYQQQVLASAMTQGEPLPSWGRTTQAKLTLGTTKLSKDGKTLAVEIKYDDTAHQVLSSFGNKYNLRLVTPKENPMKGTKVAYGMFGTDGSGVLTVHRDQGFNGKAFVIMLVDRGWLVTSDELQNDRAAQTTDSDLDKSITATLSNPNQGSNDTTDSAQQKKTAEQEKLPPIYYVRLNAKTTPHAKRNWKNDRQIVEDLFVRHNVAQLNQKVKAAEKKKVQAEKTIKEMQDRLAKNPQDTIAQNNIDDLNGLITQNDQSLQQLKKQRTKIVDHSISKDILEPKAHKLQTFYADLNTLH